MRKVSKSKSKKSIKRNFNKEYAEIMKNSAVLLNQEWNKPGDTFVKLSIYTERTSTVSTSSL